MKIALYFSLFASLMLCSLSQPNFSKSLKKYYKFVPAGLVVHDKDTLSVQAFYMSSHEISNQNYQEFLLDLEKNNRVEALAVARIHNENWNSNGNTHAPMAEHYHKHPAYKDYPVVNVSHDGASLYCAWLTEQLNKLPNKLGVKVKVRLPLHAELIRAGAGEQLGRDYPWKFNDLLNEKGEHLCNFSYIPNAAITRQNGKIEIMAFSHINALNTDILAPVVSYWPSEFGIYNLSGNAAEMIGTPGIAVGGSWRDVGHDVRLQSTQTYESANIHIGFRVVVSWGEE